MSINDNTTTDHSPTPGHAQRASVTSSGADEAAQAGEEVSELARHGDPSQTPTKTTRKTSEEAAGQTRRGIVWVRPSELMGQATARVAERGIDFQAELARRTRRLPVQTAEASRRAVTRRARRLPPVAAFGRRGHRHAGATRSGIGLGVS